MKNATQTTGGQQINGTTILGGQQFQSSNLFGVPKHGKARTLVVRDI